jgi:hypothetical protein
MCGASNGERALQVLIHDLAPADSHVTVTARGRAR